MARILTKVRMKPHFFLKFNHGVEIGARLAYLGHAERLSCPLIYEIARDELHHRKQLEAMLVALGTGPSRTIDAAFVAVGSTIRFLCRFCPIWSLGLVARTMEVTAGVSYARLARMYPQWSVELLDMAATEKRHEDFFAGRSDDFPRIAAE